mgnify:FL=1
MTQFHSLSADILSGGKSLVTMSAGNYGRSFSEACSKLGIKGKVILPAHAPKSRMEMIKVRKITSSVVCKEDVNKLSPLSRIPKSNRPIRDNES